MEVFIPITSLSPEARRKSSDGRTANVRNTIHTLDLRTLSWGRNIHVHVRAYLFQVSGSRSKSSGTFCPNPGRMLPTGIFSSYSLFFFILHLLICGLCRGWPLSGKPASCSPGIARGYALNGLVYTTPPCAQTLRFDPSWTSISIMRSLLPRRLKYFSDAPSDYVDVHRSLASR
ncbi:hypothetical protein GGS20DRAFT_3528 [Poronia punctata]|nr:hypothetical protein GGS20DRAFT_3528 [Poronia punctata]